MKITILILATLMLLWNLYGYKSYFKSTKRMQADLEKSRATLDKTTLGSVIGAVLLVEIGMTLITIAFFILVALRIAHGWLMYFALFNVAWEIAMLIPTALHILAMKPKRSIIGIVLFPLNTAFFIYVIVSLTR